MIPYDLKNNGTSVLKFSIPQSWEECTLGQLIKIQSFKDEQAFPFTKQLEIMTGIPETDWLNCTIVSLDTLLLPNLEWMKEPLSEAHLSSLPVPDSVTIGETKYPVPKNIDLKTFGQKITFQTEMAKYAVKDNDGNVTGFELNFFPVAIAIYLIEVDPPKIPFVDAKAFEFAAECEKIPLSESYPLACFFLQRFLKSSVVKKNSFTMTPQSSR